MVTAEKIAPEVLWAQREDVVFLTINVPDLTVQKLDFTERSLTFEGHAREQPYALSMEFAGEIQPDACKQLKTERHIYLVLEKRQKDAYWPQLLAGSGKKPRWLKTDFSRWRDEDDEGDDELPQEQQGGNPMAGMDMMQQLQQMGAGGAGGMDFSSMLGAGGMAGDMPDFEDPEMDAALEQPTGGDLNAEDGEENTEEVKVAEQ